MNAYFKWIVPGGIGLLVSGMLLGEELQQPMGMFQQPQSTPVVTINNNHRPPDSQAVTINNNHRPLDQQSVNINQNHRPSDTQAVNINQNH